MQTKTLTEGVSAGHLSRRFDLTVARVARTRMPGGPIAVPGPGTLMRNVSRKYLATARACFRFRFAACSRVKVSSRAGAGAAGVGAAGVGAAGVGAAMKAGAATAWPSLPVRARGDALDAV